MKTPLSRGPVSSELMTVLASEPELGDERLGRLPAAVAEALMTTADIISDPDLQLSLFCLNALHYDGFDGVDDNWEWHPGLLTVRGRLEHAFEAALR